MNSTRPHLVIALALLVSACTNVADRNSKGIRLVNGEVVNPDKVKCKSVVKTGTRLGTRVCMTNREWYQMSANARRSAEGIQRKSAVAPGLRGG